MSKLINCYHIKKKHRRQQEEDEDEEEEETTTTLGGCHQQFASSTSASSTPTTTATTTPTTKSNDCDINNDSTITSFHSDHNNMDDEWLDVGCTGPVSRRQTIISTAIAKKGSGTRSVAAHNRLLTLILLCLTLGCLHDDWLVWRLSGNQQQLCIKNAQTTRTHTFHHHHLNYKDQEYHHYGTKKRILHQQSTEEHNQNRQKSPCDEWSSNADRRLFLLAEANVDANRLYEDLMMTYNRIVRPVKNNTDRVVVKLGLKLSQLMEVVSRRT